MGGGCVVAILEGWSWPWNGLREIEFAGPHLAAAIVQLIVRSVGILDRAQEAEDGDRDVLLLGFGEANAET